VPDGEVDSFPMAVQVAAMTNGWLFLLGSPAVLEHVRDVGMEEKSWADLRLEY